MFPARYELNSYIVFRKRLVSKSLTIEALNSCALCRKILNVLFYDKLNSQGRLQYCKKNAQ
jgi:hypothetical protein